MNLHSIARVLGGEVSAGQVLCPGPGHSRKDRSLAVGLSSTARDGFVVQSFAGDDPLVCRDYVRERLGLYGPERASTRPSRAREASVLARPDNAASAARIWQESRDPRGTLVEAYLRSRGLELPYEAANEAIRFHPDWRFGGDRFPVMVCLVRNIVTNEPQVVHRTALMPGGAAVKRVRNA